MIIPPVVLGYGLKHKKAQPIVMTDWASVYLCFTFYLFVCQNIILFLMSYYFFKPPVFLAGLSAFPIIRDQSWLASPHITLFCRECS